MHIDEHNSTIILKTNELGGRGHQRRVGGKELLRKRGQVLKAEILKVWLSKLLQKILDTPHVPEQGWEHAERMTQAALTP